MEMKTTYVGMDVHAAKIQVAVLVPGTKRPTELELENEPRALRRLARRLKQMVSDELLVCYEAGPGGFSVQRVLEAAGVECQVIAPALIPQRAGDRVKTDRRDARKLAELLRAELLTVVHPPTVEQEATRDLCRLRQAAVGDRKRARNRLGKFLLKWGIPYAGTNWTLKHRRWLLSLSWEQAAQQTTFDLLLRAVEEAEELVRSAEQGVQAVAASEEYGEAVGILRCFRGVDTVTAMTFLSELGDITRFGSAGQLMAYLGLTPGEHSSGGRVRRGPITKTGNEHVRRILIESAWHYRHPARVGVALRKRREGRPGWAITRADQTQRRLHRRFEDLTRKGKPSTVANVAVARELAGALWRVLRIHEEQRHPAAA